MTAAEPAPEVDLSADVRAQVDAVAVAIAEADRTLVFTGAGVSTESGIPDFRGPDGLWKRVDPKLFTLQEFVADADVRRRSWRARIDNPTWTAAPNPSHVAIARLAALGVAPVVVTQNIDGLHQAAGSPDVVEVHGNTREWKCLDCGQRGPIADVVARVEAGDADPHCEQCGGLVKAATISFGQQLEPAVLERAYAEAERADLCLACGSTLSVMPAAGIPLQVAAHGGRVVIVNEEPTDLDRVAAPKLVARTGTVLPLIAGRVAELVGAA